jgi:hypothetical protein
MKSSCGSLVAVIAALVAVIVPLLVSWHEGGWFAIYTSPHFDFNMIPDLTGSVALVTGSNTGQLIRGTNN